MKTESYYRARYYEPSTGRFISEDPVKFIGGINFYDYVRNNPTTRTDPSGLTSIVFVISTGQLIVDPEQPGRAPYAISATSGRGGCMNKPTNSCERAGYEGPIPPGIYNLRTSEISQPGTLGHFTRRLTGDWGDWRVPLHPSPSADTLGRGGFFLHGGGTPGSAGCIDFGGGLFGNDTTNGLLQDLRNDPDGIVPVVVFPTPPDVRIPMIPLPWVN